MRASSSSVAAHEVSSTRRARQSVFYDSDLIAVVNLNAAQTRAVIPCFACLLGCFRLGILL